MKQVKKYYGKLDMLSSFYNDGIIGILKTYSRSYIRISQGIGEDTQ